MANEGDSPCPFRFERILMRLRCVLTRRRQRTDRRRGGFLALAAIYDGATRTEAAKIGDVTLQIVRDWVVKFNAHGRTA